ncbi:penicillin-binding protein 2 [Flavihumibacter solisilvae]|uniref:Peptidoglycan glycosyltransferase n=1 Tax=Flavihumibacter solisilvae TaxID=1349421 RepID=A0A0C1IK59_9BACT|nr:penicillin-binding protein 2 [Flavihumibacter solisilvae]KIC94560.1 peptidoglycan glycosyltransferase [Flavihumibacter solisilvae]
MSVFNQSRSTVIRLIFAGIFIVILVQLVNLQLFSGKYKTLALNNAVYPKVKYPDRGIIYDRKGKAILNNTIMYDLEVTPTQIKGVDTNYLCQLLGIDTAEFRKRIITSIIKNGRYRPSIFEDLLPPVVHARLEENIYKFPGFSLVERPVRTYPFRAAAHILGYIGEADSNIIKRSDNFYRLGDFVGRSGLEQYYENVLMGKRGVEYMIKDNKNRLVGKYENGAFDTAAVAGRNLRTYLDIEVQQLAEKLMKGKVGGLVAIEPKTGGIIAMASGPNYDPNMLTGPDKQKNFNKLFLDVSSPLLNRAIKGQYPPGSTFKPLGALVALDEGVISPSFGIGCNGAYYGCARPVKCLHSNPGHAANLRLAIANSCNSYFTHIYRLAVDANKFGNVKNGYQEWKYYMNAFDLGVRVGVDLPSEDKGNIPDSSVYNKVYRNSWNSCTNLTLGIGQDMMLATPLQLANSMCIIANKGYYYTPHFVDKFDLETAEDTLMNKFRQKHEPLTKISDEAFEAVMSGMQDVVEIGTAKMAQLPGINVCAKTGTAENYRVIDGKRTKLKDNSVFVCFAPREDPKIAIAVVVENAGYGGTWAGPIAALMMEKYLNDTLRPERIKEVERIAAADLMPGWVIREQYKQDSIRAFKWFKMTNDTSVIRRFLERGATFPKEQPEETPPAPERRTVKMMNEAILPAEKKNKTQRTHPIS